MIIDLRQFIAQSQSRWHEFEGFLRRFEAEPHLKLTLEELKRFSYLYERISADLARISTFSAEPDTRCYLESLVSRAYGQIHENRRYKRKKGSFRRFLVRFPQAVHKHVLALYLSVIIFVIGSVFGAMAVVFDAQAKAVIMPWSHLRQDPSKRVAKEESNINKSLDTSKAAFSAQLMTHNTRVSILAMAAGMTYGMGTAVLDFYNGVIMGAVCIDYIRAGEGVFLSAWLLPHGTVEIPAILIAVQAGFVLAGALIGNRHKKHTLSERLRSIRSDMVVLICGVALMLVWAGLIESFFSQDHEPVISYTVKILWGVIQFALLILYFILGAHYKPAKMQQEQENYVQ